MPSRQHWILLLACCWSATDFLHAEVREDSPRMTPLVRLIQKVEPAVVPLFIPDDTNRRFSSGSGTIIHPDGYTLTNDHVVSKDEGFAVLRGKPVRFRVVGRLPEKDLAIVRLRDHQGHLPTIPLGHSYDILNGESVAVVGNPGGRGIVVTSGIISTKRTIVNAPSALWATQHETKWRDDFVQFDAASNRGNSGGALVNMEGRLIGVVSGHYQDEQNASFAIPVDRVRKLFDQIISPEVVHNRSVGLKFNPRADMALVTEVAADSPAAQAGVKAGDQVIRFDDYSLRTAADWTLMLDRWLPRREPLNLVVVRGDQELPITIKPRKLKPIESLSPEQAPEHTEPGLHYEFYHGEWVVLPDFEQLDMERSGVVDRLALEPIFGERDDYFATRLNGLMEVKESGLYRVNLNSDDGSRLYLHDQLFIDHDGNHPPMVASRIARLEAGLHPVRIEYFEGYGENILEIELIRLDQKDAEPITPDFVRSVEQGDES